MRGYFTFAAAGIGIYPEIAKIVRVPSKRLRTKSGIANPNDFRCFYNDFLRFCNDFLFRNNGFFCSAHDFVEDQATGKSNPKKVVKK